MNGFIARNPRGSSARDSAPVSTLIALALLGSTSFASTGVVDATQDQAPAAVREDGGTVQALTTPFGGFNGDDVGTLPIVSGGWQGGEWVLDDPSVVHQHEGHLGTVPTVTPSLSLVGATYALDAALLDASGDGYVVRESLGHGIERLSFHGDVDVLLAQAWLASGAVEVQLLVSSDFAPGRAAVQWMSRWTSPFGLSAGQEIGLPTRIFHRGLLSQTGSIEFQALSPLGEGYQATIGASSAGVQLSQTQVDLK